LTDHLWTVEELCSLPQKPIVSVSNIETAILQQALERISTAPYRKVRTLCDRSTQYCFSPLSISGCSMTQESGHGTSMCSLHKNPAETIKSAAHEIKRLSIAVIAAQKHQIVMRLPRSLLTYSALGTGGVSCVNFGKLPRTGLLARVDGNLSGCMTFRSTVTRTDRIGLFAVCTIASAAIR
jgi:hypothetical protein